MPVEAALMELRMNSGSQFDPRVVEALAALIVRLGMLRAPVPDGAPVRA
jgi:HD-GYP domain-containing protein (c-di-GMP phosphodiesterase class II)